MNFALQIDTRNGTHHMFGSGPAALAEAETIRDCWRSQPANAYYSLVMPDGTRQRVQVAEITDVRVVVGR
jgi:hypothetical protein